MTPAPEAREPGEPLEVLVLTQEDCELCERARELLARLSEEYPFSIRALASASSQGRELAASGGILFAPGIFIDGVPFSYGRVSERKLRRELERRLVGA
ncbi:MAG: glutaredoxin family protein [Solirubrobacterales bacterium]